MATEMSSDQSRRNRRSEVSEDNAYESDMDGHIKHGIIGKWLLYVLLFCLKHLIVKE